MMKLVTIIGSGTNCGRTARNSVLTEALVFHQTLSTPKATTTSGVHQAHHEGEPERTTVGTRANNGHEFPHSFTKLKV